MIKTRLISAKRMAFRRFLVFGLMGLTTLILTLKWISAMPSEANISIQIVMILLFILTTAWISLFFWSSVFGFFELLLRHNVSGIIWPDTNQPLTAKTAILMPIYNEDSNKVYANLAAIANSLKKTGQADAFDIFVLSDTTDPKIWVAEENNWIKTKELLPQNMNLYYRRRPQNIARKSGNIEDFCHKWGALYDYMIV